MSRYMQTAADANKTATALVNLVPEELRPQVAEFAARLVNFGVRCSPRGVQSTVRLNAVRRAVEGLPVKVGLQEVKSPFGGRSFKALTTQQVGGTVAVADDSEDMADAA